MHSQVEVGLGSVRCTIVYYNLHVSDLSSHDVYSFASHVVDDIARADENLMHYLVFVGGHINSLAPGERAMPVDVAHW